MNRRTTLRIYCSCPFLNPDKSVIHRASEMVSSGDESPNYKALSVQLRKPYLIGEIRPQFGIRSLLIRSGINFEILSWPLALCNAPTALSLNIG